MPIDENWIKTQALWVQGQQNSIDHLIESNNYSLKEIELHKQCISINEKMIDHYKQGICDQKKVLEDYIKENYDK